MVVRLQHQLHVESIEESNFQIDRPDAPPVVPVRHPFERVLVSAITRQNHLDLEMAGIHRVRTICRSRTIDGHRAKKFDGRWVKEIESILVSLGMRGVWLFCLS